jgi:NADH-quinone oxidoreductase subunit F
MRIASPKELGQLRHQLVQASEQMEKQVLVCCGTGCIASGALEVFDALREAASKAGLNVKIELAKCLEKTDHTLITQTGCQGLCQSGPLVQILPDDIFYTRVTPKTASKIVEKTLLAGEVVEDLLYREGPAGEERPVTREALPFYSKQQRIALRGCGHVTPTSIASYVAHGGFESLAKALEMMPEAVIREVEASGLRGRGGGGFPTGRKWRTCRENTEDACFVVCNGDEGDPGAFMDCSIMEGDPFRVLEGMMICAHAIGARQGIIYVRNEYPRAVERLENAISSCEAAGLLGESILGSDLSFSIRVARGGGAFVCGESSALMRSIEGQVGEPRAKYIRSVKKGLHDKPTVLNNVETFACVPTIIENGGEWLRTIGTGGSPGTKAFCLVGKVRRTGLIEVPMGMSLREVIFGIGGGIIGDRPFKAVQTGGPSGGCIPESGLDIPVDFDELTRAGSMMGSGGMIVMDDHTCMVDVARYFIHFLLEESCGKCVPCREGLRQLFEILDRITKGLGQKGDIERIERLARDVQLSSLCGLGKSAPNPVLSTLHGFRDEYEKHIDEKSCPAGVCGELTTYSIDAGKCTGCMLCVKPCPTGAITGEKKRPHVIDEALCIQCGACRLVCKDDAVLTS